MIFAPLIQAASNLPTDPSALESSISALERAIFALESEIKTFDTSSWEYAGFVFTFLVFAGVVLELWVIRHEWHEDVETWALTYFGVFRSPARPSLTKRRVEIASVLLIGLGIAGELAVGVEVASINLRLRGKESELRSKNSDLRSKSNQLLALITQQAGTAEHNAALAQQSANDAGVDAGKAKTKADAVSEQAAQLDRELQSAKTKLEGVDAKRAELEKSLRNFAVCNAPRVITLWDVRRMSWPPPPSVPGETTAVDPLRPFAGEDVFIEYQPFDAETKRAKSYIIASLTEAGLHIEKETPVEGTPDGVEVQQFLSLPEDDLASVRSEWKSGDSAIALLNFLHLNNWMAKFGWPVDEHNHLVRGPTLVPTGGLRIRIGMLPAVLFVNPKGAAPAVATREAIRKQMEEQQAKQDAEILRSLTPQEATKFKAQRERQNQYQKQLKQKYADSPCQPMDPSFW